MTAASVVDQDVEMTRFSEGRVKPFVD